MSESSSESPLEGSNKAAGLMSTKPTVDPSCWGSCPDGWSEEDSEWCDPNKVFPWMVGADFCVVSLVSSCSLLPVQCKQGCYGWAVPWLYMACVPIGQLACACHTAQHFWLVHGHQAQEWSSLLSNHTWICLAILFSWLPYSPSRKQS